MCITNGGRCRGFAGVHLTLFGVHRYTRCMLARLRTRLGLLLDKRLPLPSDERDEGDWRGEASDEEVERRQQQFRLQFGLKMLENDGKGRRC